MMFSFRHGDRRKRTRLQRQALLRRPPRGGEPLERRAMLSADSGGLVSRIEWDGRIVDVQADSWIARTTANGIGDLGLVAGWTASALGEGFYAITAPGAGVADVRGWAAANPAVAYVEPDFAIAPRVFPRDASFGSLWGLHNTGQSGGLVDADIDAPEAWRTTTGSRGVVIAVIDSGVDSTHPDLAANAWRNPGEVAGDGLDNDGNGFVDDVFGWDFRNNDADPMDDNGHGTHVAGTIGAVGDNGSGVVGVNWQVSIMSLKFLSGSGSGSTSGAIAAVNYATRMKRDFGVNVVATNNSWGGGGFSTALRDAIAAGGRQNILFVAAAGNEGSDNDATPHYPSNYTDTAVISVAASDRSNRLASFSNFGATSVDLAAPGASILSTLPGNAYGSYSGTSMAAPHVAGVVGLLAAARPGATAGEIRSAILSTTTPVAAFAGRMVTGGLLNAAAAVAAILPAPPTPPDPGTGDPGGGDPEPPPPTPDPQPEPPAPEPPVIRDVGQVLSRALPIEQTTGSLRLPGIIGDGPFGSRDVDLYRVRVQAGQRLVIDVDAQSLPSGSTLDSVLRVFDARGRQVAANDDSGESFDSWLAIRPRTTAVFYVGISGYGNSRYNPRLDRSARAGSTGFYQVAFSFGELPEQRMLAEAAAVRLLGFADAEPRPQARTSLFAALGVKGPRR
ncbi:MAG: S8 family serine peptidase [Planctomycetota bacterium]